MKKRLIIICLLPILLLASCGEDWLTVKPSSSVNIDGYYNTKARIYEALVATYDPLHWFDYAFGQYCNIQMVSDVMSDDVYVGGSDETDCSYLHRMSNFKALPTNEVSDLWTDFYSGINRANCVLEKMDGVKDIDDETKAEYLAEAKVLRCFYYTWLWKLWGNVPYYEKNLTTPYVTEQIKADDLYEHIVTDLEDALTNGKLPMKQTEANYGRVTYAMAAMLYAEDVLYQNDGSRYNKAEGYMEDIIKSKKYSLATNYADLWESEGEWGTETIWDINYFNVNGGKDWGSPMAAGGSVYPKFIGINGLTGSSLYEAGWGFEPVRQETYDMFDANDARRDATCYLPSSEGATYTPRYEDTGVFLRKYLPRIGGNANCAASADMNYNNNVRIYRYSETLLNAAELLLRGATGSGSAQSYLDEVRNRAGLPSVSATLDNVLNERHLEFVGEGKRYWDLIRTGNAGSVLIPDSEGYRSNTWTENKKYLPLPQAEIDAAAGSEYPLTQNDY